MNWFWINVPLMVAFFAVWTGVPLWLSIKHPDTRPVTLAASSPADEVTIPALLHREAELASAR